MGIATMAIRGTMAHARRGIFGMTPVTTIVATLSVTIIAITAIQCATPTTGASKLASAPSAARIAQWKMLSEYDINKAWV